MITHKTLLPVLAAGCLLTCGAAPSLAGPAHYEDRNRYLAPKALQPVVIDGVADDAVWQSVRKRRPVLPETPESQASQAIIEIAARMGLAR